MTQVGLSMAGAKGLVDAMRELQQLPRRDKVPDDLLSLDFPQRKPFGKVVASAMVRNHERVFSLIGEPEDIREQLNNMRMQTPDALARIGIVLSSYILHDVAEDDRYAFVKDVRRACPQASLAIADYTMQGMQQTDALQLFTADLEQLRMREKGKDVYLKEHMRLTYRGIGLLLSEQFHHVRGVQLPGARAVLVGSPADLWQGAEQTLWREFHETTDADPMLAAQFALAPDTATEQAAATSLLL